MFEPFGEIKSAIVIKDTNGKSKGFGFVCFENSADAEKAFNHLKDSNKFEGLPPLYVNFAMKKGERQEHLMKQRLELFKQSQKMTVYAKIKNEGLIVIQYKQEHSRSI